jgi:NAD(P)-dependent dehydrogenase (short-subunit alcohol dehydrogenase family)
MESSIYEKSIGELIMDLKLTKKLALITGSTAGIGYAIAEALAREGARVIVNGRSQTSVEITTVRQKLPSLQSRADSLKR